MQHQQTQAFIQALASNNNNNGSTVNISQDWTHSIANFDGRGTPTAAADWLQSLESIRLLYKWPDVVTLLSAKQKLTGAANDWLLTITKDQLPTPLTWPMFVRYFQQHFCRKSTQHSAFKEFDSRVQELNEDISDYLHNKTLLAADLNLTVEEVHDALISGLHDFNLRIKLTGEKFKNCSDLFHRVKLINEVLQVQYQENLHPNPHDNTSSSFTRPPPSQSDRQPPHVIINNKLPFCKNCKSKGHVEEVCVNPFRPVKCFKCKGEHYTSDCTGIPVNNAMVGCVFNPGHPNMITKAAVVNKVNFKCIIDTGCQVCIIKNSSFLPLCLPLAPSNHKLFAFGNTLSPTVIPLGQCIAQVTIDAVTLNDISLIVVPDSAISTDLIIGQSFLNHKDVVYLKYNDHFVISNINSELFKDVINKQQSESSLVKSDPTPIVNPIHVLNVTSEPKPPVTNNVPYVSIDHNSNINLTPMLTSASSSIAHAPVASADSSVIFFPPASTNKHKKYNRYNHPPKIKQSKYSVLLPSFQPSTGPTVKTSMNFKGPRFKDPYTINSVLNQNYSINQLKILGRKDNLSNANVPFTNVCNPSVSEFIPLALNSHLDRLSTRSSIFQPSLLDVNQVSSNRCVTRDQNCINNEDDAQDDAMLSIQPLL
jgi:hypothetical protein